MPQCKVIAIVNQKGGGREDDHYPEPGSRAGWPGKTGAAGGCRPAGGSDYGFGVEGTGETASYIEHIDGESDTGSAAAGKRRHPAP